MGTSQSTNNCYPSRLRGRTIRLIELLPSSNTDDIECYLRTYDLDDAPEFEALSYVWGDPKVTTTITCNGQPLDITINLFRALQRLNELGPRLIWADAICINQSDLRERSHQVPLMGDIYEQAFRVIIWLGPDNAQECGSALPLINLITETCFDFADRNNKDVVELCSWRPETQTLADIRMSDIVDAAAANSIPESSWSSLAGIFDRPWFSRIWCVQEAALARDASVLIGALPPIDWEALGVVASWLMANTRARGDVPPDRMATVKSLNCRVMFLEGKWYRMHNLIGTLVIFGGFLATDPRDKIYGLVGLMSRRGGGFPLQVDYANTSMAELCTEVAVCIIQEEQSLLLLSYINHRRQHEGGVEEEFDNTLPSWVPYWSTEILNCPTQINTRSSPYRACGSQAIFYLPSRTKALHLYGLIVDEVVSASNVMDTELFDPIHIAKLDRLLSSPLDKIRASEDPAGVIDRILEEIESDKSILKDIWRRFSASGVSAKTVDRLARTLIATKDDIDEFFLGMDAADCKTFYDDLATYMEHQVLPSEDLTPARHKKMYQFRSTAQSACSERRVFWTKTGLMGLGPGCMRPNDQVVIVHGSKVPLVLRAKGDDWLFMGSALSTGSCTVRLLMAR